MKENNLKEITIITVTYKSEGIIDDCLKNLPGSSKKIIIENSRNDIFIKYLKKNYKNIKVVKPKKNLGFGAGFNLGLKLAKTKYAFAISPDVLLNQNTLKEFSKSLKKIKKDFCILSPNINNSKYKNEIEETDSIHGCAIFFNLKNKLLEYFFDEKIFIFMEEIDLCKRIIEKSGKIYKINKAKIKHIGKSSTKYSLEYEAFRNWHYMWSFFYFNKKHFGLVYAYKKSLKFFLKYFFDMIFALIIFSKKKFFLSKYRFKGVVNAFFGSKSYLRLGQIKY